MTQPLPPEAVEKFFQQAAKDLLLEDRYGDIPASDLDELCPLPGQEVGATWPERPTVYEDTSRSNHILVVGWADEDGFGQGTVDGWAYPSEQIQEITGERGMFVGDRLIEGIKKYE